MQLRFGDVASVQAYVDRVLAVDQVVVELDVEELARCDRESIGVEHCDETAQRVRELEPQAPLAGVDSQLQCIGVGARLRAEFTRRGHRHDFGVY